MNSSGIEQNKIESIVGEFLLNSKHFGCLVIDQSGEVLLTNDSFFSIFNGINKPFKGNHLSSAIHQNEQARVKDAIEYLFEHEELAQSEWKLLSHTNDYIYVDIEASVFEVNGLKYAMGIFIDRTDKKELEFDLEEQSRSAKLLNNKYALAIKTAKLGIWTYDIASDQLECNSEILEMYGLSEDEWITNLDGWRTFIHKEDIDATNNELAKAYGGETVYNVRFRIVTNQGQTKHITASAAPVFNDAGEVVKIYGVNFDVTELVSAEVEISKREQQITNITNQIPGMVYIYQLLPDGTDRFEFLSEGVELVYGVSREQALDNINLIWDQIHPDDLEGLSKSVKESAEHLTPWNTSYRIANTEGEIRYIQGSGTPTKLSDGTVQWYSIAIDITKQFNQQVELNESLKHLNLISDNYPGVIYTYALHPDSSDEITYLSKGIETIHGIKIEDAINDITLLWSLIHPDDVTNFNNSIAESAQKLIPWEIQFRSKVKDGSYRYFQGYGKPTKLDSGTILWSSISFDVHDQVIAREELKAQKEQLESITDQINGVVLKYQVSPDGTDRITYISKRVKEYWGVSANDVLEDVNAGWARIVPEDFEASRTSISNSVLTLSQWNQKIRFISETGDIKHMQAVGNPIKLDKGIVEFDIILIDITDIELAKKDIEAKQRQLEIIGDQIPGVVFTYFRKPDGTDGFSYFSDGFEELHGFEKADALADSKLIWDQVIPEDVPPFVDKLIYSATNLTKFDVQYRIKLPNGDIKYLHGFGSPTMTEDGTIIWNAVNLDITERKEAELQIQEKQKQLQSITNQIPGVVLRYQFLPDGSDNVLYVSDGVVDLYGITQQEIYNNTNRLWERILSEDKDGLKQSIEKSANSLTKWEYVFRYKTVDENIGYLHGFGTPAKQDDGSVIWDSIIMDSTQKVMAELDAVRSSEKLRSLINASPLAIYQLNSEGIVTDFWNPAAENIFGWLRKDIIGSKLPIDTENAKDEVFSILETIKIERQPKQFLTTLKNKYDEQLTLEITAGPFFDDKGELTDLLIIANDVTELQEYRKTLEMALKEKDILLQEIHHRVKNNLAIVSGLLELQAMRDDSDKDISMIIEARNRIHSIAMVHEQLYQDMDFSHINPREYYRKLLEKLQANTTSDPCDIEYDLVFDIDKININRAVPLGLLINELFTNSIKYAFKDGAGKLILHFKQVGDQITIYYEDNGPGFVVDEIRSKNTIGWQLIETLLLQLDSEYTIDTDGRFMLEFVFTEVMHGSQGHFR
ncbi:MAG: PAS domain-containing protein [Balneolaceae bacterium]|nr:PAS domain-containing protein [Balneolaceae bacterium]